MQQHLVLLLSTHDTGRNCTDQGLRQSYTSARRIHHCCQWLSNFLSNVGDAASVAAWTCKQDRPNMTEPTRQNQHDRTNMTELGVER